MPSEFQGEPGEEGDGEGRSGPRLPGSFPGHVGPPGWAPQGQYVPSDPAWTP
jgi:hypothetical protein